MKGERREKERSAGCTCRWRQRGLLVWTCASQPRGSPLLFQLGFHFSLSISARSLFSYSEVSSFFFFGIFISHFLLFIIPSFNFSVRFARSRTVSSTAYETVRAHVYAEAPRALHIRRTLANDAPVHARTSIIYMLMISERGEEEGGSARSSSEKEAIVPLTLIPAEAPGHEWNKTWQWLSLFYLLPFAYSCFVYSACYRDSLERPKHSRVSRMKEQEEKKTNEKKKFS